MRATVGCAGRRPTEMEPLTRRRLAIDVVVAFGIAGMAALVAFGFVRVLSAGHAIWRLRLPAVLVTIALAGHVVVTRALLRAPESASR